jgi:D-xylose transport system permease protein
MSTPTEPVPATDPTAAPAATPTAPGPETLRAAAQEWFQGVKSGDLGILPILVGMAIIAIVFQSQNDKFLTSGNFVNLIVQAAAFAIIGMGIVFVLLLGEIDLSIGYVSAVSGVSTTLLLDPAGHHWAAGPAIAAGVLAGVAIGVLQGLIVTKVGVPSFIVTVAGLLGWNGVVLLLIGSRGTVIVQNNFVIGFANDFLPHGTAWFVLIAGVVLYAGVLWLGRMQRHKASLPAEPTALIGLRVLVLALVGAGVVGWANQDRGVPYVFLLIAGLFVLWTYVLNRSKFGRHIYAVGGNQEAARRAGINVDRIKIACFAICSGMAAVGGIVLASRLRSVDTNSGSGTILLYSIAAAVIGGTSLFGGRGTVLSAILGGLVIASIDNGLGLLGLSSGTKFIVTGLVLLAAVTVDSLSRRGRENSGRA